MPLAGSLTNVQKLQGVTYHWNGVRNHDTTQLQYGLIAQELEAIYPQLVTTESNGYKSINYVGLVPVLIEAIKELKSENQSLKADNTAMKSAAKTLQSDNNAIKAENAAINKRLDEIIKLLNNNSLVNQ